MLRRDVRSGCVELVMMRDDGFEVGHQVEWIALME